MIKSQKLNDENGYQIALFPLQQIYVSQADNETFSHENWYYATDYLGYINNSRVNRCECYAPVDIKCIFIDKTECLAVWESLNQVHLANGNIDYLGLIVYHDNDIQEDLINVGDIKYQGEVFNRTGTGGNVTGDHVHLETGQGKYESSSSGAIGTSEYKYHFTDYTACKRLHNYDALFKNSTDIIKSPSYYNWIDFKGEIIPPTPLPEKNKNSKKWLINKCRKIIINT